MKLRLTLIALALALTPFILAGSSYAPKSAVVVLADTSPPVTTPLILRAPPRPLVSAYIMLEAQKVNFCEEGGDWHVRGTEYAGGVGFKFATWAMFRAPSFPLSMADATPQQQAWALAHMLGHYHMAWPDQDAPYRCSGGY